MRKQICILIALVLALTAAEPVLAQDDSPTHSDPTWQASYWNNTALSGTPVLQREETNLDHDWGTGSPAAGVSADGFSARWTRYVDTAAGTYRFVVTSDDGIRVWVDSQLIIDQWHDHAATTFSAETYLGAGHHWVVVEYYENKGFAVAKLSWGPASTGNWRGEYFNNTALSGTPSLVRDDGQIDFDWGSGSPAPGTIGADRFSVRWTQTLSLPAGTYRFTVTVDDGVRLWVNGHLLIESWRDQPARTYTGDIYLTGGDIPVKMEYYENGGAAVARLTWDTADSPPSGTVIVDDADPGFFKGGSPSGWHGALKGYGGSLTWTRNNDRVRPNYNWARWYPSLSSGRYEVFVFIPYYYTTTTHARYWISHAGGYTLRVVDQSIYGDEWVSLGTYEFKGTNGEYVSLADVTYEPYLARMIAFDAVKWEPRVSAGAYAPAPVPAPAPAPASCSIAVGPAFSSQLGSRPDVLPKLGCPTAPQQETWAAEERFERGRMFWQQDTHMVYILYEEGNAFQVGLDPYVEGDADDACPQVGSAPEGLYKPVRGFNRQWCNVPGVRGKVGWAVEREQGYDAVWQRFEQGHVIRSREGHVFVFFYDTGTWAYIE